MKPEETERLFIESLFKNSGISEQKPEVEKLTGDASTRRYFRLSVENKTYVVCLDDPIKNDEEYTFEQVQKVFFENKIRVPEICSINREKGFILEEDLGNLTLLEVLGQSRSKEEVYSLYTPVIDELLKIHKLDYKKYEHVSFSKLRFDHSKLHDETRITNQNFLVELLGISDADPLINIIDQSLSNICKFLDCGPWVVTHRDFHSRNIMVKNDKPVVIDFQDARLGLVQYDLVSLLEDCYFLVEDDVKNQLIEYYLQNCGLDLDNFEKYYDYMAIQRLYKAIGSFSLIYNTRGDSRYLKFIGRSFERVLSLLSKYEQLEDLKLSLAKIYYAS